MHTAPPPPLRLLPARPPPHPPLQRPLTQSNWPQQSGRRSRWWCSCMHEKGGGCGSCRSGPALHAPPTHPAHAQAAMHPTRSSHLSTHTRTTHQLKHAPARLARPSPRSSCGGVCVCARVGRWGTRRAGNCAMTACHPSTHPTHPAPTPGCPHPPFNHPPTRHPPTPNPTHLRGVEGVLVSLGEGLSNRDGLAHVNDADEHCGHAHG